jgi:glycine betaine/proline transport system substrate-binding protein
MKKLITILSALALVVGMFAGQASAAEKVKIAYVEWSCATASTYTAKAALEKMGYEVEVMPVAAAAMWQAVASGDVDGMVTAWLPVTHQDYLAKVKNDVEVVRSISGGARLGWAVPTYVTIDSIADLKNYGDEFDEEVIGIDPGAGLMGLSEKAMKEYGLEQAGWELVEGSGATMTASLANALRGHRWIVVTAWSPHWMFGRWDLKYLKDPKGVLGEEEHIDTVVRDDLKQDRPNLYKFFKNFHWKNPDQFQMVMAWNQENGKPYKNAEKFIKEYPEMFKKWTKGMKKVD